MAAIATTPTTTPAAMPALLGPGEDPELLLPEPVGVLEAVTMTVWPPIVTTDGDADAI